MLPERPFHFPFSIGHFPSVIDQGVSPAMTNDQWKMENGKWK
jgi:hypothetical protein